MQITWTHTAKYKDWTLSVEKEGDWYATIEDPGCPGDGITRTIWTSGYHKTRKKAKKELMKTLKKIS